VVDVVRAVLREPFSRRARLELLWAVISLLAGVAVVGVVFGVALLAAVSSELPGLPILVLVGLLLTAIVTARTVGGWHRQLAARLLGAEVSAPPPLRAGRGVRRRLGACLRDGATWRALAYTLVKVPLALGYEFALVYWVGLVNLTYPFWWGLFRNHDPGVELDPVPAITPFGFLRIATFPGTLVVFVAGLAAVLAAPWVTRGVIAVDRWLMGVLLGPGRLAARVRHLEESRDQVVDDAAATLRRIERDLHDGAQTQLATLAMKLGQAKEKLERDSDVAFDPDGAHELVDAAHRHAREALVELRNIAQGVHPPALDVGLDAALATLVARSPVPAHLYVDVGGGTGVGTGAATGRGAGTDVGTGVGGGGSGSGSGVRPAQAIETIAYFSVAELLANVAKHSRARHVTVEVTGHGPWLRVVVSDDGVGGAQPDAGRGLSGLVDRARAVDGRLDVVSPPGGPTVVVVELPLRDT
jgi:signal transduction histidine kinase